MFFNYRNRRPEETAEDRMIPKRFVAFAATLLFAAMLSFAAAGCTTQQAASSANSASAQTASGAPTAQDYETVLDPKAVVSTFIAEKFSDQKITNEDEALAAIKSVYNRIGADDTTDLEITAIRPTETGTTYYIFNQKAGDVLVRGASVKVIVDKDNTAIGLVSAILPKVGLAKAETWAISAAEAEQIVVKQCESNGHAGVKVQSDATEQMLIPFKDAAERPQYQYAWVVYTPNFDTSSEMHYLAHYVDADGRYLYAIPIAEPHNADAVAGDKANFDFEKYEQSTWSGPVTLHDGSTKEIEVPVLVNKEDNTQILADSKRKILCADYADWTFEQTLSPRINTSGSFDNTELLAYDTFVKVWDFYDSIGWTGPDGEGTPTLLLMDYVDENRKPIDRAYYSGRQEGFQTFAFNRLNPDGENMDVIAHEFTHGVTSTAMITIIYLNDPGAINEGMSDVLGNLVEMLLVNKPESAWLIGDSSGVKTLRSMKDPHAYQQPEYRWDTYYAPNVIKGTEVNDLGGVHVNSSLLNVVSYKLDQAGMPAADQVYFWMNVALAMTAYTDYEQLAQLLPWCMEQSGYAQYNEALKTAISEGGYASLQEPSSPPAGSGKVSIKYSASDICDNGLVRFTLISAESNAEIDSWPTAKTYQATFYVPAGDYSCHAFIGSALLQNCKHYVYSGDSWIASNTSLTDGPKIHVEEGKTLELSAQGLPESVDALS